MNLLIVDDESFVIEGLLGAIEWEQLHIHQVYAANSGEEALLIMEQHSIDILLSDIHMPVMNGLELIRIVSTKWDKTKCILLTGYNEFEYAQAALKMHVVDYILKPASDESIMSAVSKAVSEIQLEWERISSHERSLQALRENLPLIRGNLLGQLLLGKSFSSDVLSKKLDLAQLHFLPQDRVELLLIRLGNHLLDDDPSSTNLYEYAITNMAEEIFSEYYELWHAKDPHDFLCIVLKEKRDEADMQQLESLCIKLQHNVRKYLKDGVTILVSPKGQLVTELPSMYHQVLTAVRSHGPSQDDLYLHLEKNHSFGDIDALRTLYAPPLLQHLLEAGRWEEARHKLQSVCMEIEDDWAASEEHVMECLLHISSSFAYIAHKSGHRLSELLGNEYNKLVSSSIRTVNQMQQWAEYALRQLEQEMDVQTKGSRSMLISKIQSYIQSHIAGDLSLTALAEQVYIHPAYISRLYKEETGETISDYILRQRMEQAAQLLKHQQAKVYEVGQQIGYMNVAYFIRVFRQFFGITPLEYKEKHVT